MKTFINSLRSIGLLTIALTLALAANFAYGQWANPPATAPGGNIDAPINVGNVTQYKSGNLGALRLSSSVNSATSQMRSPQYCDSNGQNCVTAVQMYNAVNNNAPPPPVYIPPPAPVRGCMERGADNYNSRATVRSRCLYRISYPTWNAGYVSSSRGPEYCQYKRYDGRSTDSAQDSRGANRKVCWEPNDPIYHCAQCDTPNSMAIGCYQLTSVTCYND